MIFPLFADKREVGLPGYNVTNLTVSRTINRNVDVFLGVQNLFGTVYYVATNPDADRHAAAGEWRDTAEGGGEFSR